jgi:tyrosyl-tRNA synthetase
MEAIEFLQMSHLLTYQQVVERDMFQERIKKGEDVFMNELLYPVLQAYDSVFMNVDLEIGGTDQMFNMMMGRKLMRKMKQKEKYVLTVPLLTDANGVKIGKTEGNVIGISDEPNQFYSKIMSLADEAIINCFTLLTDKPEAEIATMKQEMEKGTNPMQFKKLLAFELTSQFNSATAAAQAQDFFEKTFQQHDLSAVSEFSISNLTVNPISIINLLEETHLTDSKSEARRLIEQKAVEVDQTLVDLVQTNITLKPGMTLKVGKKKFLRFI